MNCPYCTATETAELTKRTQLGYRIFRCSACRRQFNERTGTPYNYLEFPCRGYLSHPWQKLDVTHKVMREDVRI